MKRYTNYLTILLDAYFLAELNILVRDTITLANEMGDRVTEELVAEIDAIEGDYFDGLILSRLNDAPAEHFQSLVNN